MYGSIFRMKVKPGQEQKLVEMFKEWEQQRRPKVKGVVASYLLKPDRKRNEMVAVAVFQDKQTYRANADDPEQDRWYRRMRELLEADPEWEDGEFVASGR